MIVYVLCLTNGGVQGVFANRLSAEKAEKRLRRKDPTLRTYIEPHKVQV
jgi:hypothetical protein